MAKKKKKAISQYEHTDKKRVNNPPVGLVTPETDPEEPKAKQTYEYDPHLDPQLVWAGKAEHTSFEVPTVSLHVHERIDPKTIIRAVKAKNGSNGNGQMGLFESTEENPPLRDAIDFYKHAHNWSNRLIAGDSLLVMNSLLEKEGMAGKVQMVYIDPPYGITYGSNFQPFVNKRDVKDGKDDDLTHEPEMLKAFRDTWELGIHSYLTYLRDRLLLAHELLHESGSCFLQISDENLHRVRNLADEVFGSDNIIAQIAFIKTSGSTRNYLAGTCDYLLFYCRNRERLKYRALFLDKTPGGKGGTGYTRLELVDGTRRLMTTRERNRTEAIPEHSRIYCLDNLTSQSVGREKGEGAACWFPIKINSKKYRPNMQSRWKTNEEGMAKLQASNRLEASGSRVGYVRYLDDFQYFPISDFWDDVMPSYMADKVYVVQTSDKVIARCMLMCTDPGDLVFDPTCGSGTTAFTAEQWGRRWITTDTSRVAITLAKQRLMTGVFDYYRLAHPDQGVGSGFKYKTVPHVMLKSITSNPEIKEGMSRVEIDRAIAKYADQETLYDQLEKDKSKARVTGPFTVEAVPAAAFGVPVTKSVEKIEWESQGEIPGLESGDTLQPDASITRSGESSRQAGWRDELFKTGIRATGGKAIEFVRLETLAGTRWLHADGETKEDEPHRIVVSFGPEHAPLEQRQVAQALEEASLLVPKPKMVIFAAFHFDPEAAKDIDETIWPGVTLLKAQMNGDLFTEDLKKKRSSNESFWLIGQPDIELRRHQGSKASRQKGKKPSPQIPLPEGEGLYVVEVMGFDYYDPKKGVVESGGTDKIACWMLDTDYDGRAVYPRQVFFPMSGAKDGWSRLAKNLKAEIDPVLIEAYRGTVSLPFEPGEYNRVAVKIIDDRGIESLRILELQP